MRVVIVGVEKANEHLDVFKVCMGDQSYDCPVSRDVRDGLEGFRFESSFIEAAFYFDGIGATFGRDYWKFQDGQGRSFPWDYGEHDEMIVSKAQKLVSKTISKLDQESA